MNRGLNIALLVILVTGVTARFIPVIVWGNLFSTDIWPLYRDSIILLRHPEISIWDDTVLDGYNNHWPAVILSTLVVSRITDLNLWVVYSIVVLCAVVLVLILSLYLLYDHVLGENKTIIALILAVFYPSLLVFTSALLKEVYGLPLLVTVWYFIVRGEAGRKPWIMMALLISICLIYTHYFTLFMLVGSLSSYIICRFLRYLSSGQVDTDIDTTTIMLLLIITSLSLAVSILPNTTHIPLMTTGIQVLVLAVYYSAIMFLIYGGQLFHSGLRPLKYAVLIVVVLVTVYSFIVLRKLSLIPGMSLPMDITVLMTGLSVVLAFVITILGIRYGGKASIFIYSWIMFIGANTVFIMLYAPLLGSIIHRFLNYIFIPLSIGISYVATKNFLYRMAAFTTLSLLLASSFLLTVSTVTYGSPYLFYWIYRDEEVNGFETVLVYSPTSMTICGDAKIAYYSMTIRNIDTMTILRLSILGGPPRNNSLYVVYRGNKLYGYVVNAELYDINGFLEYRWSIDRLFDNGWVEVYSC